MHVSMAVVVSNIYRPIIAVFYLTVDGCTLHVYCTYGYDDDWLCLPRSNVTSYVSM